MNDRRSHAPLRPPAAASGILLLLATWSSSAAPAAGQDDPAAPPPPLFADVWIGGPLDSLYNAEYARLHVLCEPVDPACFTNGVDTTAALLAPVRDEPGATEPAGWLIARLGASGTYLYATLLYRSGDGGVTVLVEDLGDWGYGTTLPLAETAGEWLLVAAPAVDAPMWLSRDGTAGFGVAEVFGLEGRLWRLGPVEDARTAGGGHATIPAGVYLVLDVAADGVRLRPELPADMPCGDPIDDAEKTTERVPVYEVPLERLIDRNGLPTVEKAYPKGC